MSRNRHEGITCDVCSADNFTGKRYKCLACYDYDLCARCFDGGLTSNNHSKDHPVQCILTKSEFDIHFAGDNMSFQRAQAYTCPLCGTMGFTVSRMREHVLSEHGRANREVICPVCATLPGHSANNMTSSLGSHLGAHLAGEQSGRSSSTDERLANIRRHLSPSQAESGARRRTSGAASSNNETRDSRADARTSSDHLLRATGGWMPTASPTSTSASGSAWPGSRQLLDPDLADYNDYLALHESILSASQSERLRERLAAEASRHDPNSPLYKYLSHPRFAGSGLRAAAASGSAGQPAGPPSNGAQQQQQAQQRGASGQFPSNYWECLMNSPAPPSEFVLPGLLGEESLSNCAGEEESTSTSADRAGFGAELLLSLLDIRLDGSLLEHLEALSSDSEPETSLETDV